MENPLDVEMEEKPQKSLKPLTNKEKRALKREAKRRAEAQAEGKEIDDEGNVGTEMIPDRDQDEKEDTLARGNLDQAGMAARKKAREDRRTNEAAKAQAKRNQNVLP
jgi:hypothetical protein